jgi:F0F1-type ATP synthase assembly protein I
MKKNSNNNIWFDFGIYSAMGIQLVLTTIGGLYFGQWIESYWHYLTPWVMVAGSILGMIVGFINLMRLQKWKENRS